VWLRIGGNTSQQRVFTIELHCSCFTLSSLATAGHDRAPLPWPAMIHRGGIHCSPDMSDAHAVQTRRGWAFGRKHHCIHLPWSLVTAQFEVTVSSHLSSHSKLDPSWSPRRRLGNLSTGPYPINKQTRRQGRDVAHRDVKLLITNVDARLLNTS